MTELADRIPATVAAAPTLVEGIQNALREAIATGRLPSGYRLREIPLAAHFECSTTPVREALRKLEHEGLVKVYPRRGAEVTAFSLSEVEHLYEARLVLETYATRRAAERKPSQAELEPVHDLLARQEEAISDAAGRPPLNAEFHEALTALAGNTVISELAARLTRQIEAVQARSGTAVKEGHQPAVKAHRAILRAMAKGDADRAEKLMREHLEWTRQAVSDSMRENA